MTADKSYPRSADDAANVRGDTVTVTGEIEHTAQDVTSISSPSAGMVAYHDGTGVGLEGVASYDGSNWFYANGVTESAAAETPQGTYQSGQIVYFTDSGDASGDGTYIIDDGGTPQGPL